MTAGEHRRTRCDNCKAMFYASEYPTVKLTFIGRYTIEKRIVCGPVCAKEILETMIRIAESQTEVKPREFGLTLSKEKEKLGPESVGSREDKG